MAKGKKDVEKSKAELITELDALRGYNSRLKGVIRRYERAAGKNDVFRSMSELEARKEGIESLYNELFEKQKVIDLQGEELEVQREELIAQLEEIEKEKSIAAAREAKIDSEARHIAAEAAEVERRRFFNVLETLPAMVCLLTPDYRVAFANRAFREKFGEANGRHCYEYCFGSDEPCEFCEAFEVLKTGRPYQWEANLPDGSVVDVYDFPFTDVDGSPMVLEMDIDITERKKAEAALKDAKDQAELYLDLMGHDINNMNMIAMGYLEIVRDAPPLMGGEQREYLGNSIEVLQRSAALIKNVRNLQKLREGAFQRHDVDLCRLLVDVQREFGAVPHKAITVNLNGCDRCHVRANELLHDVFANLVSNAIKHTGDKADISIDLDIVDDNGRQCCRVNVEDNGPGIPDVFKEKIFHRMRRGTANGKGMGLGLYIVSSLVESYDGKVWVEDRVKGDYAKGARFVVMLPTSETGRN